ncbi:MAG: long-chain fatty acid--CoA ligase [Heliobacteriaceae bacterium]|nr:long-chain fatty acid--CoA ligase [Heliobacteriaceae bacterium]MDD4588332.1 long-chain fatty acid--CoA ligase [Heliobacteriaceae bacterium]
MLVHQLVGQGTGEQTALVEKGTPISYAVLQTLVPQYRDYLYAQGVRAGDKVGLFAKNSAGFVISYLAIASLGSVVIPLNTMFTPREIAFIVQDAGIKHLITDKPVALEAECPQPPVQLPPAPTTVKQQAIPAAPPVAVHPDDPCVILYTSGTTGRPKGAILSHTNVISNARAFGRHTQARPTDNFLCVLPMFHSFAWSCSVMTPLYHGATITVAETFSPKEIIHTIRDQGITVVTGVPAMYGFYASLAKPEDLAGVRLFISGGAALPLEILKTFYTKTKKNIVEGYGLSEASPVVTCNPLDITKPGSIGVPLPGVAVKTVDDQSREVGPGEVGELITQGPSVMTGYLGLPAETAAALRDGWLYTGDLAYQDEDGYVFIVDRKKDLVIVGGLNVYPREVEEIIYQYPAVKEAAVIGVPDKTRGECVRAYVAVHEGQQLNKKELMTLLKANLATYKLPREIVEVPALPKNATGKILKKELRKLFLRDKDRQ